MAVLNPFAWNFRRQMLLGFLCCAGLLAFALYAQTQMLLMPCPLCILQRIAFVAMGVLFLIAGLHAPGNTGRKIYALLVFIAAAAGAYTAGYHLWLQNLPADQVPMCSGVGLDYLVELHGPLSALKTVFSTGSGDCAKVDWIFLCLSMPGWTLLWYIGLGLGALYAGFRKS